MEPLPWMLLVCLLLTCRVTVLGNRLSGTVGVQHCDPERILKGAFPEKMYRSLQSYRTIPSIGSQPEYMEFTMKRGQKFCVIPQKAQLMKEYVDSQSRGNEKLIKKMPQASSPALPKAAQTDPMGEEGRTISSLATTPLPTVEGQDYSNGSSTLSIPQSTRLYEEEGTPTSSPSTKPFPGLKEQDLRPLFPLSKSTGPHKEEGAPTLDPPTTLYARPQEQMEEWRPRPTQDQPVAGGDVPIGQEPTESSGAKNTGTSAAETPQDGSKDGGGRSTAHISSPARKSNSLPTAWKQLGNTRPAPQRYTTTEAHPRSLHSTADWGSNRPTETPPGSTETSTWTLLDRQPVTATSDQTPSVKLLTPVVETSVGISPAFPGSTHSSGMAGWKSGSEVPHTSSSMPLTSPSLASGCNHSEQGCLENRTFSAEMVHIILIVVIIVVTFLSLLSFAIYKCCKKSKSKSSHKARNPKEPNNSLNHIIKFADDTTVVGLISKNDKSAYREEVQRLMDWRKAKNLSLNVEKRDGC